MSSPRSLYTRSPSRSVPSINPDGTRRMIKLLMRGPAFIVRAKWPGWLWLSRTRKAPSLLICSSSCAISRGRPEIEGRSIRHISISKVTAAGNVGLRETGLSYHTCNTNKQTNSSSSRFHADARMEHATLACLVPWCLTKKVLKSCFSVLLS